MSFKLCSAFIDNNFNIIKTPPNNHNPEIQEYFCNIINSLKNLPNINNLTTNIHKHSIISLCNYQHKNDIHNISTLLIYLTFRKFQDGYIALGTNWLDYIKLSSYILEDSHTLMNKLDKITSSYKEKYNTNIGLWKNVSKAGVLKAFEPLVNFIPKPLRNRTNSYNLYNVMKM